MKKKRRLDPFGYPILSGQPPATESAPAVTVADALQQARLCRLTMSHGSSYSWRRQLEAQLGELVEILVKLDGDKAGS
jgi:hypothetical protein